MSKKIFRKGQFVVYAPTDVNGFVYKTQIGEVKCMSENEKVAFVYYHEGCIASGTPVKHLYPIENAHLILKTAFNLTKK